MKLKILFSAFLFLIMLLQSSLTTMPFIVGIFVLLAVFFQKEWVALAAFLAGIIFDIMSLRPIGSVSIFLTILVSLLYIYQNKFEIQNSRFIFVVIFVACFIFLKTMNFNAVLLQSFLVSLLFSGIFYFFHDSSRDRMVN